MQSTQAPTGMLYLRTLLALKLLLNTVPNRVHISIVIEQELQKSRRALRRTDSYIYTYVRASARTRITRVYSARNPLLLLNVLQAVKRNGNENNNAREHKLQVCVDAQNCQRIRQCCKDDDTYADTGNLTNATGK